MAAAYPKWNSSLDAVRENVAQQLAHFNCPQGTCLGYFRFGLCPRASKGKSCFYNTREKMKQGRVTSDRSMSRSPVSPRVSNTQCDRCGLYHSDVCKWRQACYECGGMHAKSKKRKCRSCKKQLLLKGCGEWETCVKRRLAKYNLWKSSIRQGCGVGIQMEESDKQEKETEGI